MVCVSFSIAKGGNLYDLEGRCWCDNTSAELGEAIEETQQNKNNNTNPQLIKYFELAGVTESRKSNPSV